MQSIFVNWNFRIEIRLQIAFELNLHYIDEFLNKWNYFSNDYDLFSIIFWIRIKDRFSVNIKYKKRIKNYRPVFWLSEGRPGLYCRIGRAPTWRYCRLLRYIPSSNLNHRRHAQDECSYSAHISVYIKSEVFNYLKLSPPSLTLYVSGPSLKDVSL